VGAAAGGQRVGLAAVAAAASAGGQRVWAVAAGGQRVGCCCWCTACGIFYGRGLREY
jgi:hypothetical protein